jgi:PAS domain-containing protein
VYYRLRPRGNGFLPDPEQIESLVSSRTRAIVLINPNNPTGANYPRACWSGSSRSPRSIACCCWSTRSTTASSTTTTVFQPVAPLAGDLPCMSFGGLSKVHRACGWRVGWAVLSGDPMASGDFHHALDLLGALRLCANVPGQFAIEQALHGTDTITALVPPRAAACTKPAAPLIEMPASASEHLSLVAPAGRAVRLPGAWARPRAASTTMHSRWRCWNTKDVLMVPGSSFNVPYRNHFRVTLLPERRCCAKCSRASTACWHAARSTRPAQQAARWRELLVSGMQFRQFPLISRLEWMRCDPDTFLPRARRLLHHRRRRRWRRRPLAGATCAAALRADCGIAIDANPRIIATTGWTTDELVGGDGCGRTAGRMGLRLPADRGQQPVPRALAWSDYLPANSAVPAAARDPHWPGIAPDRVLVLSIPDWGVTPFGANSGRDRAEIARQLDAYNAVVAEEARRRSVTCVDIAPVSRKHGAQLVASDGLHPSATLYSEWTRLALPLARRLLESEH